MRVPPEGSKPGSKPCAACVLHALADPSSPKRKNGRPPLRRAASSRQLSAKASPQSPAAMTSSKAGGTPKGQVPGSGKKMTPTGSSAKKTKSKGSKSARQVKQPTEDGDASTPHSKGTGKSARGKRKEGARSSASSEPLVARAKS